MAHKHLRIVIIFGTAVLCGLVAVQTYWFQRAFDVAEQQFDHSVQVALKRVGDTVSLRSTGPVEVKKLSSGFFLVVANSDFDMEQVDNLVLSEFVLRGVNIDYELGIYKATDDTLVYGNYVQATKQRLIEEEFAGGVQPGVAKNFAVYFPKKKGYLVGELKIWIFSTVILLLMIGFFAYAIFSLLKEKRFSDQKNDFVNNMTHELKTPVTNIRVATEILLDKGGIPERSNVYLEILQQENHRLQQKIDHVLRAASGDYLRVADHSRVDIHQLIEQCSEAFQLRLKKRDGTIKMCFEAKNAVVNGDRELLLQALENIIDNAEKYSPNAPEIEIVTKEQNRGLEISIRDLGIGIPHHVQHRVFEKFFRVQSGNVHNVKGFGLGLNFVKNVVRAHRGAVRLLSEVNRGTEVSIFLPR